MQYGLSPLAKRADTQLPDNVPYLAKERTMTLITVRVAAFAFLSAFGVAAQATLSIAPTDTIDQFRSEPGQSIPTGVAGWVGGTLVSTAGLYTFTYGRDLGLVPGATGFGNSTSTNEFTLVSGGGFTAPAGACFSNGSSLCSNTGNLPFTVNLPAGLVPFQFIYNQPVNRVLANGQRDDAHGAYLVTASLGTTPFAGPSNVAYLGLSDGPYPTSDRDFQDLVVRIAPIPEPGTLALIGAGLAGIVGIGRRRRA